MMKIPRVTLQKILEAHPISKEALLSIESKFKTIRFAKGDIITKEGEIQNKIFFIRSGMLRGYYLFSNHEITSWLAIEMEPVTSLSSFFDQSPSREFIQAVEDMGNYLKMHLGLGTYNNRTILSKEMALAMQTPQLLVHPQIESFCYGFYEEYAEGLQTIGHGGDMLGYSSYMAMVPEKNLGIFVVHHHEGARLRYQVLSTILSHFNPNPKSEKIKGILGKDLSKFTGEYLWSTYCHSCEDAWRPTPVVISKNDDNTLTVFGLKFIQIDELLFQTEDGSRKIGFTEDNNGKIKYMSSGASNVFEKVNKD